ncbi:EF hand domain-containing protein [Hyphomonas adhaerens MHS-3]|uniref:peptidylprolyl isomerase n=1 Tax=Hyphomonas adhaerens MHS-3 TaxID=1280949 RepID=A0A069E7D6_9PROT|nr:EF-hand domain-containing protein [Hyphomonas adhaerens]KCZ85889.1 EF hand domain-containing protein [Hyphomonas adhaerens MHS-3]
MKRIVLATASLAAIAAIALPAAAYGGRGDGMQRHSDMMKMLDTDGDGTVSEAEIKAHKAQMFPAIDTNDDGVLSQEELSAHQDVMRAQMKSKFESRRGDRVDNMFDRYDTNKDGSITRDEVAAVQAARTAKWEAKKAERQAQWAEKSAEMQAARFAKMDTDGNGTISQEEFESAPMGPGGPGKRGKYRGMGPGMGSGMVMDDMPAPPEDE